MPALMFAALADLYKYGAPARAFGTVLTDADKTAAIGAASDEAYGSFRSRGQGDIVAWDTTVTMKVCHIAAYELMCVAGFNPNAGADRNFFDRAMAARTWLRSVSKGEITPAITFATAKSVGSAPQVRSRGRIGW